LSRANRSGHGFERTPEERERDRAERARRRAASHPDAAPAAEASPAAEGLPTGNAASAPQGPAAAAFFARDPAPAAEAAPPGEAGPGDDAAPAQEGSVAGHGKRKTVRNGAPSTGRPTERPPGEHPPGGSPRRARGVTRARVGALLALALAGAVVWFCVSLFQPFAGAGKGSVIVEIPKGSSAADIGSILAHRGVVASSFFFDLRALLEGKRGDLHSGRFKLKRDMSYSAAIAALSKPPPAVIAVKVVIPEGFSRAQIARLARADTLKGDYLAATLRSSLLDPARLGAPARTPDLEGFLFPATYDLSAGAPVARLVRLQLGAFRQRFGAAEARRARLLGVTPYGLLTIASMVEREARTPRDRPLIAAVIYNRLRRGMPLGVDATIYYALAQRDGPAAYERQLTASDLLIDSPYNTRRRRGLPPTPIANPGMASILAAAHPARVDYLYYVAAPDGCGEHRFSSTEARFQADVAAYREALQRNGGHLPACARR